MSDLPETGKPKREPHKRWSPEEENRLAEAFRGGKALDDIATDHERSIGAITARLHRLDLILYGPYTKLVTEKNSFIDSQEEKPENTGNPWDEREIECLLEVHRKTPTLEGLTKLAKKLERTPRSLALKLLNLGEIEETLNPNPNPAPPPESKKSKKKKELKIVTPEKPTRTMRISITPEFQAAHRLIEARENVLILGSAGTGKSTFLKWLRKKLGEEKNYAVLAPTGMAALQVGGQTIHSFFGLKPQLQTGSSDWRKPRSPKIYENLDMIIIDEISMVRADVFDAIDRFLRRFGPNKGEKFGGVQVVAMGDLFQLPPIVRREEMDHFRGLFGTPFFFGSGAWQGGDFYVVEFTHIFRQSDEPFINLLTKVRYGERGRDLLQALNARLSDKLPDGAVILAARNRTVDSINERELERLSSKSHLYRADTTGKVDEGAFNSPVELVLKQGARVMFTRNDTAGRWVNGTLGEVIECNRTDVKILTDDGQTYTVEPVKWELTRYEFDEKTDALVPSVAGTFTQLPLTLAWALTIHKAQGQTLENCVIDLSDGGAFAEGQLYVALSRARALDAIHLTTPIGPADIRTSSSVLGFYEALQRSRPS